jgi:hypothetical protein
MTSPFDHLVLTRFNVRLKGMSSSVPAEVWLRGRIDLFDRYCVPSFAAQSRRGFRWIVLIDAQSPAWLEPEIRSVAASHGVTVEVRSIDGELSESLLGTAVADLLSAPYVITTRVDSDDVVATDFVERIQDSFVEADRLLIDLVEGAQFHAGRLYLRRYRLNPFLSLIEKVPATGRVSTVLRDAHPQMSRHAPVRSVRGGLPAWVQVVHGGNYANEVVGRRVSGEPFRSVFPTLPLGRAGVPEILWDRLRTRARVLAGLPSRALRRLVR